MASNEIFLNCVYILKNTNVENTKYLKGLDLIMFNLLSSNKYMVFSNHNNKDYAYLNCMLFINNNSLDRIAKKLNINMECINKENLEKAKNYLIDNNIL